MECDICSKSPASLPFHCITCARNAIYELRIKAATILLEKEDLGKKIENAVPERPQGGEKQSQKSKRKDTALSQRWSRESAEVRKAESEQKTVETQDHILVLREEIENAKDEISRRRAALEKRRQDFETVKSSLPGRRTAITNKLADSRKKGLHSWLGIHNKTTDTRAFLCREAAVLYGLKQKKRARGDVTVDQYLIGGLPIVDLKEINGMKLTELSASLSNTVHLVVLVSFYLSVRLPAEITLAHRDYPLPTIFTPANSYAGREVPFPGSTPAPSSSNSPATSRHGDLRSMPRPRPLFLESKDLDETVPQFAKRDPIAFNFFLEAISLLAWDVAWLCRSQGHYAHTETWEDVCNIGRNLWQLLLSQPQSPGIMRVLSSRDVQSRNKNSKETGKENVSTGLGRTAPVPRMGSVSHSSAYSFLGGADAQEFLRGWKVNKYTMIVDPLKKLLIGEMNNAEWELLQEQEWDDGGERFDGGAAVLVRDKNLDGQNFDEARSIMTATTTVEDNAEDDGDSNGTARVKGTSGWTKVRGRDR